MNSAAPHGSVLRRRPANTAAAVAIAVTTATRGPERQRYKRGQDSDVHQRCIGTRRRQEDDDHRRQAQCNPDTLAHSRRQSRENRVSGHTGPRLASRAERPFVRQRRMVSMPRVAQARESHGMAQIHSHHGGIRPAVVHRQFVCLAMYYWPAPSPHGDRPAIQPSGRQQIPEFFDRIGENHRRRSSKVGVW